MKFTGFLHLQKCLYPIEYHIMSRKLTTEQFVKNAIGVHGHKYCYSKSKYCNSRTKLTITCNEHGDFQQTPGNHCQGVGCPKCHGTPKSTTSEFIEKSRKIHGDKFIYDKVDYTHAHNKITITCHKHGDFQQTPNNHLNGAGCMKCCHELVSERFCSNTADFIEKAREAHADLYDYHKTDYSRSRSVVIIVCKKHGEFTQNPHDHLRGNGCWKCGLDTSAKKRSVTLEEFITKSTKKHRNKYDYSRITNIDNTQTKVEIICQKHGVFEQLVKTHLRGNGCKKCAGTETYTTPEYIKKAKKVHGEKYNYTKTNYEKQNKKLIITCRKHGDFIQLASGHLSGAGCPICRESRAEKKARLYLTSLNIKHKQQHRFSKCRNKRPLPFDFIVFYNNRLHAIECQGRQHYEPVKFSTNMTKEQAQNNFEITQGNDNIKREWCLKHDIPLLEIPYFKSPEPLIAEFMKIGAKCEY